MYPQKYTLPSEQKNNTKKLHEKQELLTFGNVLVMSQFVLLMRGVILGFTFSSVFLQVSDL